MSAGDSFTQNDGFLSSSSSWKNVDSEGQDRADRPKPAFIYEKSVTKSEFGMQSVELKVIKVSRPLHRHQPVSLLKSH